MYKVEVTKIERTDNNNQEVRKSVSPNGFNSYVLIFLACFCIQLIIENYTKYGIIKGPLDILHEFTNFVNTNWTFYAILLAVHLIQLAAIFSIEKSIALKYLPENLGLVLHGLNISLLPITTLFLLPIYKINPVAGHITNGYIGCDFFKKLSYVLENNINRSNREEKQNNNEPDKQEEKYRKCVSYVESVTVYNLLQLMFCTGNLIYAPNSLVKDRRQLKKCALRVCFGILIHYFGAFIIYQYITPEANLAKSYIDQQQHLKLINSVVNVMVPVNLVWVLFFYFWCMKSYLPMFGWFWGYKNDTYVLEWWNAKNMTEFWSRWNYQVYAIFKRNIFTPLVENGYSKRTASIAVAFCTAVLHEYLIAVPFRSSYGLPFISYLLQIPIAIITTSMAIMFGDKLGNIIVIAILSLSYAISTIILSYNYVN